MTITEISPNVFYETLSPGDYEIEEPLYKTWIETDDGSLMASKAIKITKRLKAGIYSLDKTQQGYFMIPEKPKVTKKISLPNQDVTSVIEELRKFWSMGETFNELNIIHKRGILLHGPAGTGKSSIIDIIADICVREFEGLIFYVRHRNDLQMFLDFAHFELKQLEGSRNIITIIEDIDNLYEQDSTMLTAFLDGEDEIEHNVVIATTNYINELSDVLTRPSRFDQIIEVNLPDEGDRRELLKEKFKISDEELDLWVKKSEGLSIAALKELYISVRLFGNDIDETIKRLNGHDNLVSKKLVKSSKTQKSIGF